MSYSFFVPAAKAPAIADLLGRIAGNDLIVVNEKQLAEWPAATITLCRRLVSTRGVYLSYDKGEIQVKINVFSAAEDYALALQLVAAVAAATGKPPRGEDSGPMSVQEVLAAYDGAWIKESHASALRITRAMIKDHGPMGLGGPYRTCYVGPRVLQEMGQGTDEAAITGILDLMRRVQWLHLAGYDTASDFTIGGTKEHLAIWFPQKHMFLPSVHWVTIDHGDLLVFPFARLADVLGKPLTLVDECQPLIEPTPSQDLPALIARARQYHKPPTMAVPKPGPTPVSAGPATPPASPKAPAKPWWKIW